MLRIMHAYMPENQKLHGNLCMPCTCVNGEVYGSLADSAVSLRVALALIYYRGLENRVSWVRVPPEQLFSLKK